MFNRLILILILAGCAHNDFGEIEFDTDAAVSAFDAGDQVMDGSFNDSQGLNADAHTTDSGDDGEDALLSPDGGVPLSDMNSPDSVDMYDGDFGLEMGDVSVPPNDAQTNPGDASVEMPDSGVEGGYTLCGRGLLDRVGRGTWTDPILIGRFPFLDRYTTSNQGESRVDSYDCAPDTGEKGKEVVYRFEMEAPGDFLAVVEDDGTGVDVDLHLLRDFGFDGAQATGCLGRAHKRLLVERLEAGTYFLVVDSWSNAQDVSFEGAYDLAIDIVEHRVWREVPLESDITWMRYRGLIDGSWQTINALRLAPSAVERMRAGKHAGCQTVAQEVNERGAIAGINAGYFTSGCTDKGFLRVDDTTESLTLATTSSPPLSTEARVGWRGRDVWFRWGQAGSDWTQPAHAFGSHPMLYSDGEAQAQVQQNEQVYSAIDWANNPRTAMALTRAGEVILLTLDGRTSAGAGMSTPALASWLGENFELSGAIGFDGGGSTTFVVNQCWVGASYGEFGARAFNSPSDNEEPDEFGARGVSSGIYAY